jgi:hypothetical protein
MNVEELKNYFESNGGMQVAKNNPNWQILFDTYRKQTGNKLMVGCGSCYAKAWRWLQKQ